MTNGALGVAGGAPAGWASSAAPDWHRREWGAGAASAAVLHAGLALAVLTAAAIAREQFLERPELAVEIDMGDVAPPPMLERTEGAGGGGAGGAIPSPQPLTQPAVPLPPLVPPEFIEPVKGAPVVRTEGPPPVGYGAGFGGGMGGGIGGGTGGGIGTGAGGGVDIKPKPETPVQAGAHYDQVSTAVYSSLIRYPQSALDDGLEGTGGLSVVVTGDGKVLNWGIEQSTGHAVLDKEIGRVARKVQALDPIPGLPAGKRAIVHVKIYFQLAE